MKKNKVKKKNNHTSLKIKLSKKSNTQQKQENKLSLFGSLVRTISELGRVPHLMIGTLAVGFGFLFNRLEEMPLFWLKGIFGFFLYVGLVFTIDYIEKKNKKLEYELTGDPQLVKCQIKYKQRIESNLNFLLCCIACIYFVAISIILGFVEMNPIGIYSLFALSVVVFLAFIVFQYYMFTLLLLRDLSKISPENYYELIPERTNWFDLLATFSNICRSIFIVLGSLFILLFITFSPVNNIKIIFQEKFLSFQFLPLLCTWIIILVAIIFMVPVSSFTRNILLKKIHSNLISHSIKRYNKLYEASDGETKLTYMNIIFRLNDYKYVSKASYTWILSLTVSVANFTSLIISIIVDLKDLNILT